ncbi:MAG TPA: SDR family NAD(P)-dependent oxidoreductase [Anaerolineales bacterium]|nr:SDR family NAD(P)-dependent oxidoreductase [Anaerolineales bacterium]
MLEQVAVTGASGSVGQALVSRLLARGLIVKGLVRSQEGARAVEHLGGVPLLGDVCQPSTLAPLLQGCSVVFHLAAWMPGVGVGGRKSAEKINVAGTANVVRLAAEYGCRRVVHASSIAVYGPETQGVVTEATPTRAVGDPYGDTKIEGEQVAMLTAQRHGIELTILRPTMIYGPRSPSWTLAPFETIARGLPVLLGDGQGLLDAVYVDDVAQAFELAGFNSEAAGEVFIIGNEPVAWNAFMDAYACMAGTRVRRLPVWLARLGLWLASRASALVLGRPITVPAMVGVMTSRATFSSEKACTELGYHPEVDLVEGMRRTRAWLREQGRLRFPSTALVTGANGGLGRAVVQSLHARGLEVWAADLVETGLDCVPGEVHPIAMDVTSDTSVVEAVQTIAEKTGVIDLLVNTAGVLKVAPLETQPLKDVLLQMEVNTLGPLRVIRAVAQGMRQQGRGLIINIGSTNSFVTTPFFGAYSASKSALNALSQALRMELNPWGVEVVVIHPSSIKTSLANHAKQALLQEIDHLGEDWRTPLEAFLDRSYLLLETKYAQSPEQVAQVVARIAMNRRLHSAEVYASLSAFFVRIFTLMPSFIRERILLRASGYR